MLKIATCQFGVCGDIKVNLATIKKQMLLAMESQADIAHFSECSLSGYAGWDFRVIDESTKTPLKVAIKEIAELAMDLGIWVIVGSHHFRRKDKPYNSLYLIDRNGDIRSRYNKRLLTGASGEMDREHYSPGKSAVTFEIKGIKCGLLICHEWRYPEVYREYGRLGAKVLFQSWYDGNLSNSEYEKTGIHTGDLIMGCVKGNAANNYLWISASNTSKKESGFPSFVVQPDGRVLGKLRRNRPGVLISKIDPTKSFEDPSKTGRAQLLG